MVEATLYRVSKKVQRFWGLWNEKYVGDFKTKMLIYQSKANLDEKILFGKITHYLDPEIRKMLEGACLGSRIDRLAILQKRLDRALFLYIFIHEVRFSGVRASFSFVQIRKFDKM